MPEHQLITKRHEAIAGGTLAAIAVLALVLFTGGAGTIAKASTLPLSAAYPALNSTEPSGLPLITTPSPNATPTGPVFLTSPPPSASSAELAGWPEASSIRRLPINLPIASAWIAKSMAGGVCILDARHQPVKGHYGIGVSCAEPGQTDSGTYLESIASESSIVSIMGVVSTGVSAVQVTLTDGTSKKVPVTDGAWALETEAHLKSVSNVVGG